MSLLPVRVVRLVLPYPPRANRYWRLFTPKKGQKGQARMIVSTLGKAYKAAVRELVRSSVAGALQGPLRIDLDVFRPRRAGDVDGHAKVLFDALQRDEKEDWPGLYLNDAQAFRVKVEHWDHQPRRPRVQATVTEDANPRQPPGEWPLTPEQEELLARASAKMAELMEKENERAKSRKAARAEPPFPPGGKPRSSDVRHLARPASYPARSRRGEPK
jgi:Holliday junction resolvase RusA-like endonuclease